MRFKSLISYLRYIFDFVKLAGYRTPLVDKSNSLKRSPIYFDRMLGKEVIIA